MILIHIAPGKEAVMHTQTAEPILTEDGTVYFVECAQCGPLGMVAGDTAAVTGFMYDHALAGAR